MLMKFSVTGMSCAACSARVEKAVSAVSGVEKCAVNLLTNSMTVEGNVNSEQIIRAVEAAGYGATAEGEKINKEKAAKDGETAVLIKRLVFSLLFLTLLMYVSMGHVMWSFPLPYFLSSNPVSIGLVQLMLTAVIMVINQKFFVNGFKGIVKGAPNMDTLVALGSSAAFVYSTYELFAMSNAVVMGGDAHIHLHNLYFESAAMILTLITVGKMLEANSKKRTTDALTSLMKLSPKTATLEINGEEKVIPVEQVKVGDIFVVKSGDSIPVDGEVIEGSAFVDESAITGESIPVDKNTGDMVRSATISKFGFIKCRATRVGEDTTLSKIIAMVSEASSSKAPIARVADKVSGVFVPIVISIALITLIVWLLLNKSFGYALARGIAVLVISCPCALGLATPVAIMVGSGVGAKKGILFKTAAHLENTGKTNIVVLDKTGTITLGQPRVTDIISDNKERLLSVSASIEKLSEHPLSIAVTQKAQEEGAELKPAEDFNVYAGNGISATVDGAVAAGGNLGFISNYCTVDEKTKSISEKLSEEGKTPLFFSFSGELLGIIAVADTVKEDSKEAVKTLKNMGIKVVMLTGDNYRTANAVAKSVEIDEVIAEVLPDGKEKEISKLKKQGKVMMVGDGINDAPSLMSADIGVAVASGTDIATDSADIVLMNNRLSDIPAAITLSRKVLKNIHQNLFWAFIYNTLGIPLAAGVFVSVLGWELSPMFGAAAMSLSSFCVVTNALRLNLVNIYKNKKTDKKEEIKMEKTMKIEGMMCPHCEARVKTVIEEIDGVAAAVVSHKEGNAVVTLEKDIDVSVLKKTVEDAGYKVLSVE